MKRDWGPCTHVGCKVPCAAKELVPWFSPISFPSDWRFAASSNSDWTRPSGCGQVHEIAHAAERIVLFGAPSDSPGAPQLAMSTLPAEFCGIQPPGTTASLSSLAWLDRAGYDASYPEILV